MSGAPSRSLLATAALLAMVVAAEVHFGPGGRGESITTESSVPGSPVPLPAPSLVLVAPLDALTETVERPLFMPERRPAPEETSPVPKLTPAQQQATSSISGIVLSAVVMTGETRLAFLRDPATGRVARLAVGDRLGNWTLEQIRSDRVTVTNGTRNETIPLRTFKPAPRADRARKARDRADRRAKKLARQAQGESAKAGAVTDQSTRRTVPSAKTDTE